MRIVFTLALLAGAIFYTYVAFDDLSFFNRRGRLGAGFFPRLIGVAAVITTLWILVDEWRRERELVGGFEQWRDVLVLVVLSLFYAVLLRTTGGFVATVLFLGLTLTVINPGRHLTNGLVAVLVPVGVYLLFDKLLNASMPPGWIDLPI